MSFNINRLTEKSQAAVLRAQQIAEELNNSRVEPEHLFAALLQQEEGVVPQVLQRLEGIQQGSLEGAGHV